MATEGATGDSKPGLTAVPCSRESDHAERASSTRSLHNRRGDTCPARDKRTLRCSQASIPGHRSTLGAPPAAMKGLRGESLFTGAPRFVRKQVEARVMRRTMTRPSVIPRGIQPSRCEDSRVRECDLIMRCVASPPRCPSDRHRPLGAARVSVWLIPSGFARLL